jgi:hypothetical protein
MERKRIGSLEAPVVGIGCNNFEEIDRIVLP